MQNGIIELELFLTNAASSQTARISDRYKLTSGAIQENWAIDVEFIGGPLTGLQELCLRMDAPSGIGNSRSRIEEFALLKLAYENGVRVPEPLFFCKDKKIIGRQFFIMRRIPGIADARSVTQFKRTIDQQDELLFNLGTELAAIHALKPSGRDFSFLKKPRIAPALHVINQYHAALDALPQPAPILEWGLNIDKKKIPVNTENFETNKKRIFAIGDICSYPGKLKLILSGFHEGALAARGCFKYSRPNEKYKLEFTTTSKTVKDRLGVKE